MKLAALLVLLLTVSHVMSTCGENDDGCAPMTMLPLSSDPPSFVSRAHPLSPSTVWGRNVAPFPTNSFFTNSILEGDSFPITPVPYQTKVNDGIDICYPQYIPSQSAIISAFIPNMRVGAVEQVNKEVVNYDQLSVTFRWNSNSGANMHSPLVRGSPYVTMEYEGLTPLFSTVHAILSMNGNGPSNSGTKFKIQLNNGQKWIIYSLNGTSIGLSWSGSRIQANAPFHGVLRIVLLADDRDETYLDASSEIYPVGGEVSYSLCNSGNSHSANIKIDWATRGNGDPSKLLLLALPHHTETLRTPNMSNWVIRRTYRTLKGRPVGVLGNSWVMNEVLSTMSWHAPTPVNPDKKSAIIQALNEDKGRRSYSTDPYWFGKEISLMARLALIADHLGETETAASIRSHMKSDIDIWLVNSTLDKLSYDSTWGGISTTSGMNSPNADYGGGWYNDHHFHYGYFIYAAAVIGKEDKEWLNSRKSQILDLVRDIANPSDQDPYFVSCRHKDWYDGHSWASGLFPFGDSKNQESSSEAVNAYYAISLLGEALNDTHLTFWGKVLLATEIRAVHKYWHMTNDSDIYDPVFSSNMMVGIVWSNKVDHSTWFGGEPEYVHGINIIPFTPITEELLPADWVSTAYPTIRGALTRSNPPIQEVWKSIIYLEQAVVDREAAWNSLSNIRMYDTGNTKTNAMYWIATRP